MTNRGVMCRSKSLKTDKNTNYYVNVFVFCVLFSIENIFAKKKTYGRFAI